MPSARAGKAQTCAREPPLPNLTAWGCPGHVPRDLVPVLGTWSQCRGCGPSAGDAVPVPGLRSQCRGHAPGRDQQQVARCKAPVSCSSRCCMAARIPSSVLSHCGTDSSKSQPEARGATARYFPSKTHAMLWLQTSRFDFIGKECCEPGFREQFISRNFFPW